MCQKGNQVMARIETLEEQYQNCFHSLEQEKRACRSLEEENRQLRKEVKLLNRKLDRQTEPAYLIAM